MAGVWVCLVVAMATLSFAQGQKSKYKCPADWIKVTAGGRVACVYFSEAKHELSWTMARKECVDRGGDLLKMYGPGKPDLLSAIMKLSRERFRRPWTYSRTCADNKWRGRLKLCALNKPFICDKKPTELFDTVIELIYKCPSGWSKYKDGNSVTCVYFSDSKHKLTWRKARKECVKLGGNLVKIDDSGMNDYIKDQISGHNYYWIGLHDLDGDGKFQWLKDKQEISFDWWDCKEPNNHGGRERCVEIIAYRQGRWNDKQCNKKRPFICQMDATKQKVTVIEKWSCDFEPGKSCNLIPLVLNRKKVLWSIQKSGNAKVGPKRDHAGSRDGHYAVFVQKLSSMEIRYDNYNKDVCLTFWYRVSSPANVIMRLYSRAPRAVYRDTGFRLNKQAGISWTKGYMDIASQFSGYVRIQTYLKKTKGNESVFFAVDDIKTIEGPCNSIRGAA